MNKFAHLLIGAEGAKTPAGVRGRGDPAGAKRRGGSPYRPRTARAWSGNQQTSLMYKKEGIPKPFGIPSFSANKKDKPPLTCLLSIK
ncbi:hypothetical protein J7E81_22690 [Bacillus sp. ISL-18]|uniref:hypothetical protein n=1 Tax=Bacillus sp. ISL-18 TaxID=2819118 RepID=UPI001BE9CF2E|nr:hypothetical protein [Bacillus sp. ISL-18]MBT2658010.1 hypothetical protein [Bacillus sp. ISL-18]